MVLNRKTGFAYGVVLLSLLALGANGWRPYKIIISDHSEEMFSPKCRMNASFSDSGKFNYYVEYLSNIRFLFIHTAIYFQSDDGKYDIELLNRTVDLCKFYKNKRYEPMLQAIYKVFEDYSTHWFRCPVNKGVYYIKNLELDAEKMPPFFPEKSGLYEAVLSDKHERLFRVRVYFQVINTFKKN